MAKTEYCSFCGKAEHEVFALVDGPMVHICDECVVLVSDVIKEKRARIARSEPEPAKFRSMAELRKDRQKP